MPRHDCGEHLWSCEECRMPLCPECDETHSDEAGTYHMECHEELCRKEEAGWAWMKPLVARHVDACRSLDIPTSSTDAELMEAARRLK